MTTIIHFNLSCIVILPLKNSNTRSVCYLLLESQCDVVCIAGGLKFLLKPWSLLGRERRKLPCQWPKAQDVPLIKDTHPGSLITCSDPDRPHNSFVKSTAFLWSLTHPQLLWENRETVGTVTCEENTSLLPVYLLPENKKCLASSLSRYILQQHIWSVVTVGEMFRW